MMDWISIIEKGFWGGCAAVGFAILFNVPVRALMIVFALGAIGIVNKFIFIENHLSIVLASFISATLIGILSVNASRSKQAPTLVFAIPAAIPLIPGILAYKTMLGIISLTDQITANYLQTVSETINNGTKTIFIILAIAVGVAMPQLILRKESTREMGNIIKSQQNLSRRVIKRMIKRPNPSNKTN